MASSPPFRRRCPSRPWRCARALAGAALFVALAGCGGGASNPFDNPASVANPDNPAGQHLAFAYFQTCIEPILNAQLPSVVNGVTSLNTCAGAGCHAYATGAGGALRIVPNATVQDLTALPAVLRASDMYKNFYSAQGEVVIGSTAQSRLLAKPLLQGVLHGGGLIFPDGNDVYVKRIKYWITHPAPLGTDEFDPSTYNMFTPANPSGTCNIQ